MNETGPDTPQPWNIYTSSDPSPSQAGIDRGMSWRSSGSGTSMNAVSYGFVATAILISMFLIMALFEHLFRPSPSFSTPEGVPHDSLESGHFEKHGVPQTVSASSHARDFSVLMPGQQYPTHLAQPAPFPCSREGIYWPPHEHYLVLP